MKKILIIGGVLVVVIVGVLILGVSNLGPIIQKAVNSYGPDITGTQVRLGDVDVSLFSGQASLKDFFLGNPKGFTSKQAIRVGSVLVDVDEKSLASDIIVIDKIAVIGPEITYEKVRGTDNFQAILKNVQNATGQTGSSQKAEQTAKKEGTGKKLLIRDFLLKDGKVTLSESILAGKSFSVPLPEIALKNVGNKGSGASPAQTIQEILAALYGSMTSPDFTNAINQELKKIGADIKNIEADMKKQLDTAKQEAENIKAQGQSMKKGVEDMENQIKGLLGK